MSLLSSVARTGGDPDLRLRRLTMAFSCGARSPSELEGSDYLRKMLSRRQLQGFVRRRREITTAQRALCRLTTATICRDHGWHEDIDEDIADHHRAGVARLPRSAQIANGRAGRRERIGHVPRPVVRGARRHASLRPAPRRDPPGCARREARRYPPRAAVRPHEPWRPDRQRRKRPPRAQGRRLGYSSRPTAKGASLQERTSCFRWVSGAGG